MSLLLSLFLNNSCTAKHLVLKFIKRCTCTSSNHWDHKCTTKHLIINSILRFGSVNFLIYTGTTKSLVLKLTKNLDLQPFIEVSPCSHGVQSSRPTSHNSTSSSSVKKISASFSCLKFTPSWHLCPLTG